jgi:ATP-binding cassette subfamily F protein 3
VVSGFSGGERSRLALAKLLLEPKNLLFLDEPTNHLDIPAAEILEEALVGFEGTVVLVSHDRRFLETVSTRVVRLRNGLASVYPGGFRDFERAEAAREGKTGEGAPRKSANGTNGANGANGAKNGKEVKARTLPVDESKKKYDEQRDAARTLEKKRRRIKELEGSIATGERELDVLRGTLKTSPGDDWEKLAKMAKDEQSLTRRVDSMLIEWARLSEEVS